MTSINAGFIEEFVEDIQGFFQKKPFPREMDASEVDSVVNEHLETLERGKEVGLFKIGEGRNRLTFESRSSQIIPEDCVLKVSMNDGTVQNQEAIETWRSMGEDAREYVVPFVEWDSQYRWIIQRQASHTTRGVDTVIEGLKSAGWVCSDIRSENIGLYGGSPVLIDLGVGLRRL